MRVATFDSCQRWDGGCGGYSEQCNSDSGHVKRRSSLPGVSNCPPENYCNEYPLKIDGWKMNQFPSGMAYSQGLQMLVLGRVVIA